MADQFEFLPDRFSVKLKAIDEWKRGNRAFPDEFLPVKRQEEKEKEKETTNIVIWAMRGAIGLVPWGRIAG